MDFDSPLTVRVAIVGSASIAKKNALAILRSERCTLVAVASRSLARAQEWCASIGLDGVRCVEGYESVLADGGVDAVYVPLPTTLHRDFVLKAAAAGKHVLVEKPVGVTAAEVREMVAACRAGGVALLDGTMFVHHARFAQIDRLFRAPNWTPLKVSSTFAFRGGDAFLDGGDIRTNGLDPLGCLGDVGWYCIRFGLAAFAGARPTAAAARLRKSRNGVPTDMDCDVVFGGASGACGTDARMTFHCSFYHPLCQTVEASSVDGRVVRLDDFVIPRREEVCEYVIEDVPAAALSNYDTVVASTRTVVPVLNCCQEAKMWDALAGLVAQGAHRTPAYEDAMVLAHDVMDALMKSAANGGALVPIPEDA